MQAVVRPEPLQLAFIEQTQQQDAHLGALQELHARQVRQPCSKPRTCWGRCSCLGTRRATSLCPTRGGRCPHPGLVQAELLPAALRPTGAGVGTGRLLQDGYAQSRIVGQAQLAQDQAPALQGGDPGWAPHLCSTQRHQSGWSCATQHWGPGHRNYQARAMHPALGHDQDRPSI